MYKYQVVDNSKMTNWAENNISFSNFYYFFSMILLYYEFYLFINSFRKIFYIERYVNFLVSDCRVKKGRL